MKVLGMGLPELLIILAVVLLIFGPKNLPKLGSALGKTVKGLRDGLGGSSKDAEEEVDEEEEEVEDEGPIERTATRKKTSTAKKTSSSTKSKSDK